MPKMIIHTHGWKADRDRTKLTAYYRVLCKQFFVLPVLSYLELARLNNFELHRLCQNVYDQQAPKELRWFNEMIGARPRSGSFRWRWFWYDLFHPGSKPKKQEKDKSKSKNIGIPFLTAARDEYGKPS